MACVIVSVVEESLIHRFLTGGMLVVRYRCDLCAIKFIATNLSIDFAWFSRWPPAI